MVTKIKILNSKMASLSSYHQYIPESDNDTKPQSKQDVACIAPDIVESTQLKSWTSTHEVVVASIFVPTPMENLYKIYTRMFFFAYNDCLLAPFPDFQLKNHKRERERESLYGHGNQARTK